MKYKKHDSCDEKGVRPVGNEGWNRGQCKDSAEQPYHTARFRHEGAKHQAVPTVAREPPNSMEYCR